MRLPLKVDFVLISGDIYDRDQQSIAATDFLSNSVNDLIKPTSQSICFTVTMIIKLSKMQENFPQMFMFLVIA